VCNTVLLALALASAPDPARQEVRLHLVLSETPWGTAEERSRIRHMEEDLLALLEERRAGALASDEWSQGTCVITFAAGDARVAWRVIEPAVRALPPRPGSFAVVRAGPKGAPEERIALDPPPDPTPRP
jgi:hypothetical protein